MHAIADTIEYNTSKKILKVTEIVLGLLPTLETISESSFPLSIKMIQFSSRCNYCGLHFPNQGLLSPPLLDPYACYPHQGLLEPLLLDP